MIKSIFSCNECMYVVIFKCSQYTTRGHAVRVPLSGKPFSILCIPWINQELDSIFLLLLHFTTSTTHGTNPVLKVHAFIVVQRKSRAQTCWGHPVLQCLFGNVCLLSLSSYINIYTKQKLCY